MKNMIESSLYVRQTATHICVYYGTDKEAQNAKNVLNMPTSREKRSCKQHTLSKPILPKNGYKRKME